MSLYHCITSACLVLNLRRLVHPGIQNQRRAIWEPQACVCGRAGAARGARAAGGGSRACAGALEIETLHVQVRPPVPPTPQVATRSMCANLASLSPGGRAAPIEFIEPTTGFRTALKAEKPRTASPTSKPKADSLERRGSDILPFLAQSPKDSSTPERCLYNIHTHAYIYMYLCISLFIFSRHQGPHMTTIYQPIMPGFISCSHILSFKGSQEALLILGSSCVAK